jgi:beta-ureidopropionase
VHKRAAIDKHVRMIREAAQRGAQIVCLQELFYGPYFCTEQNPEVVRGDRTRPRRSDDALMQDLARELGIALVVPLYEAHDQRRVLQHGRRDRCRRLVLGAYRKHHIPQVAAGPARLRLLGEVLLQAGQQRLPTFQTRFARVGVYICYDRHFPEGARLLGLNGAEIVFNPSATVAGLSEYLWKLEQPAHAVANGYYVGAINRVGFEAPWNMGEFYGQSYLVDPRGQFVASAAATATRS